MRILSMVRPVAAVRLGLTLLILPVYFITASVLRQNAPGLSLLGNPIILLGVLFVAFALNALSILSVNLRSDTPPVLSISLSLRFWNLTVIATALLLFCVLLGYAFVENFQPRPQTERVAPMRQCSPCRFRPVDVCDQNEHGYRQTTE